MVVFTCNHCGESLHKPKVEKHYSLKCRKAKSLTCVDCLKDFYNEDYSAHVKCVTEEERYSAKGTFAGGNVKKGEAKQESWVNMIKSIVEREKKLSASVKNILNIIGGYTNIPRKKAKFINFIKNSTHNRFNPSDVEAVWDIIEKYNAEQSQNQNGVNGAKKRKIEEKNGNDNNTKKKPKLEQATKNGGNNKQFDFKQNISKIVSKKREISLKSLQEQVLKVYKKAAGVDDIPKEVIKTYNKQLRKIPNIVITNDKVSLTE